MYCTEYILHQLPTVNTIDSNINELSDGADSIGDVGSQNISLKLLGCDMGCRVSQCRFPRRKLEAKAELLRVSASGPVRGQQGLCNVHSRARVVHRAFTLQRLGYSATVRLRLFRRNAWDALAENDRQTDRRTTSVLSSIFCHLPLLLHSESPGRCRFFSFFEKVLQCTHCTYWNYVQ